MSPLILHYLDYDVGTLVVLLISKDLAAAYEALDYFVGVATWAACIRHIFFQDKFLEFFLCNSLVLEVACKTLLPPNSSTKPSNAGK